MAFFILVPGAWHGAWCFEKLATLLHKSGHTVATLDLPGMVPNVRATEPVTLALWVDAIAQLVARCPEPPIVLGHSRGGIVISEVAERIPKQIGEIVYLAGALLPTGTVPLNGLVERMPPGTKIDQLPEFLPPPPFEDIFATAYSGCAEGIALDAYSRLVSEPLAPLRQALNLTPDRFGIVSKTYIETLQDKAVTVGDQRAMLSATPCDRILQLDCDHSPFLSDLDNLTELLNFIAENRV